MPGGLVVQGDTEQFCCAGCRAAHAVIMGCGLGRYYEHREAVGGGGQRATGRGASYAEFDDPAFGAKWCTRTPEGLASVELYLEGVHCAACVWLVERLGRLVDRVVSARLDVGRSMVRVVWDDERTGLSRIARGLDRLGYRPHAARGSGAHAARVRENRAYLIRIAAAGALAGNVMLVSVALYGEMWGAMDPAFRALFRYVAAGLGLVCLAWPGSVFFRGAIGAIRARGWSLDMPITAALTVGAVSGIVNVIRGTGEIYFDSLTMLVFLLLIGRWLQARCQRGALDAVELMSALTPRRVRIVEDGVAREASIEAVEPGCIVEVRADESVPVDGVVIRGESSVDAAVLTGEPVPIAVGPGDTVSAGSVNLTGPIRIEALAVGEATRMGRVMRQVEALSSRKGRVQTRVDRFAGWFVLGVMSLAVVTFAIWWRVDAGRAVAQAIALLIVTCPCALALATPLTTTVAMGRAARGGILVKGADALDGLARGGTMLLDKTGTITHGRFEVVRWTGDESARSAVAAIESHSAHPIARALCAGLDESAPGAQAVRQHTGLGATGAVGGHTFVVGSARMLGNHGIEAEAWARDAADRAECEVLTPIFVARDGEVVAVAALGDEIRADAADAVQRLRERGWRVGIVSGDRAGVVERVANRVGIERELCRSEASPEEKVRIVERALGDGVVVMVGDGVNDAAALCAATVGVAVQGGAEASLDAADVYIGRTGLSAIVDVADASVRTRGIIRRCLAVSLAYNVAVAALAMAAVVSPIIGAVLMPISSLTVLAIAVRSRSFEA